MSTGPLKSPHSMAGAVGLAALLGLSACGTTPPAPDWQVQAKGAMDRATRAYLQGHDKAVPAELRHARSALAQTGQPAAVAQAELLHCAAQVASLVLGPCAAWDALAVDATPAQRAYAAYLQGHILTAEQIALLPAAQRPVAQRSAQDAQALPATMEPLSLLVAAAHLLQRAQCPPAVMDQAIDTASQQGWRRPLLAWLTLKHQGAVQAQQKESADQLARRLRLLQGQP